MPASGFIPILLGLLLGLVLYPVLEKAGTFEQLRNAAELQLMDFLRDPERILQLAARVAGSFRQVWATARASVLPKSGLPAGMLGLLFMCSVASRAKGLRWEASPQTGASQASGGGRSNWWLCRCARRATSMEVQALKQQREQASNERVRRFLQSNTLGVLVALAVVIAAAVVLLGQQRLDALAHEESSLDARVHLFDWTCLLVEWIGQKLRTWLNQLAARPDDLRQWLCLNQVSSYNLFWGAVGREDQKCWLGLGRIVDDMDGLVSYATESGNTLATHATQIATHAQNGTLLSATQNWSGTSQTLAAMRISTIAVVTQIDDGIATAVPGVLHATLVVVKQLQIPSCPNMLWLLLCQMALPLLVPLFRQLLMQWRSFNEWPQTLRKAVQVSDGAFEWILRASLLFTAGHIMFIWLVDALKDETSQGSVQRFAFFCRLRLSANVPAFQRFVGLCVLDTFNTTMRLTWAEAAQSLRWQWSRPQTGLCRFRRSMPPLAWLAIAPPMYIFWCAAICSTASRSDLALPVALECLSRVVDRPGHLADRMAKPVAALLHEAMHFWSRAPLEICYASLVVAFVAHSFMPGGCVPACALLMYLPVALLRGCAAWADFSMDAKRKVIPDFKEGPGTLWACNMGLQGACLFHFSRTQLHVIIESPTSIFSSAVPLERFPSQKNMLESELEAPFRARFSTGVAGHQQSGGKDSMDDMLEDEVISVVLRAVFERMEGEPPGVLTTYLNSQNLEWISQDFKDVFFADRYGTTLKHVINALLDRFLYAFMKFTPGSLRIVYQPIVSGLLPEEATLPSILRYIAPHFFVLAKQWLLVEEKRECLRDFICKWVASLQLHGGEGGSGDAEAEWHDVGAGRALEDIIPPEQAALLKDWVSLQANRAFLIGLRGVVLADPKLGMEERVPPARIARTSGSGPLCEGSEVQVQSAFLPATDTLQRHFMPHHLLAHVRKVHEDGSVDVQYSEEMAPLIGYPDWSEVSVLMYLQPESQNHPLHMVVSDFGLDIKFESADRLHLDVDWAMSNLSNQRCPKIRINVLVDRITVHIKKACVRLGTEGLVYGSRNDVIMIEELMLHSGSLQWMFDLEVAKEGLCITTHSSRVVVGELDLPTVKANSKATGIINFAVGLFARQIKDLIPEQVEKALNDFKHMPTIRWEDMHALLNKESAVKATDGCYIADRPGAGNEGVTQRGAQISFACWAEIEEDAPQVGWNWFAKARPQRRLVWLEIHEVACGEHSDAKVQELVWYDCAGRYAFDGAEHVPLGRLLLHGCQSKVVECRLAIEPKQGDKLLLCAGSCLELLHAAVKAAAQGPPVQS